MGLPNFLSQNLSLTLSNALSNNITLINLQHLIYKMSSIYIAVYSLVNTFIYIIIVIVKQNLTSNFEIIITKHKILNWDLQKVVLDCTFF